MADFVRLGLCAPLLILTAPGTGQSAQTPAPGDVCARLANNIGVDKPFAADGRTTWSIDAQRFPFGGSTAIVVGVDVVEPATAEDYQRLQDMCTPGANGAICRLSGPVNFNLVWKGKKFVTPVAAGERATISVLGSQTMCSSEASSPQEQDSAVTLPPAPAP